MIKEIMIENYRGISKKRILSFIANSKRRKDKFAVVRRNGKEVLLSIALIGKNASGKSTFIDGINFFEALCYGNIYQSVISHLQRKKASKNKEDIPKILDAEVIDIILDREFNNIKKPMKFQVIFLDNKTEVMVNIEFQPSGKIIEKVYQDAILVNKQEAFLRDFQSFHFDKSIHLKRIGFQKISEAFEELLLIHWAKIKDSKFWNKKLVLEWLNIADDKITNVEIEKNNIKYFYIKNNEGETKKIYFSQLSTGTKKWANIAIMILPALFEKQTFIYFDEIERSLHPGLAKFLINIFNNKIINKKNSQLLFTTHSPNIIDEPFRKDAINFIDDDGKIINIGNDLKVREDLSIAKNYYAEKLSSHPNKQKMLDFLDKLDE